MRRLLTALVATAVVASALAAAPAYADAPSAPTSVSASGGYRSVSISVVDPGDDATGYQVSLNQGPWRRLALNAPDSDPWPLWGWIPARRAWLVSRGLEWNGAPGGSRCKPSDSPMH